MHGGVILYHDRSLSGIGCLRCRNIFGGVGVIVHELLDWFFSGFDEFNCMFRVHRWILLCDNGSVDSDWRMRSWNVLGHLCNSLLELLCRHLLSFSIFNIMLGMFSGFILRH